MAIPVIGAFFIPLTIPKGESMFWTLLIGSVFGILLINLGAMSVMVAVLATAFKVALVVIVLLVVMLVWRRFRIRRVTWRKL
jgi:hypothetical protein